MRLSLNRDDGKLRENVTMKAASLLATSVIIADAFHTQPADIYPCVRYLCEP